MGSGLCVLMVDDSADDAFLVERALGKSRVGDKFLSVDNGNKAIAYLRGEGVYGNRTEYPFPNILLLDLKMPHLDGFGVLEWLQQHPECKIIPTVIFSSSAIDEDIHRAYVLGANAFLVKPANFEDMVQMLQTMHRFWSNCHVPPPPPGQKCS
jgi:CheY-like chemotaxis protein